MEAVVIESQFVHEFESKIGFLSVHRKRVVFKSEGLVNRAASKHVDALCVNGVPVAHREFEMFAHSLAHNDFVGIVVLEAERIVGVGSVFHLFDIAIFFH